MCIVVVTLIAVLATIGAVQNWQTGATIVSWRQVATSTFIPLPIVMLVNLACAFTTLYTLLHVYFDANGIELRYLDVRITLIHLRRWTTFTVWCFTLLFFYFALATFCSAVALFTRGDIIPNAVVVLTLILFEISYPTSLLVTIVVNFVLLPVALKNHYPTARMFRWRPLIMHNLNVLMMQIAMLMTAPPITFAHLSYVLIFGCAYAIFAWYWFIRTGIFYYFFLDYRRPYAVFVYIGLLVVLVSFYGLGYLIATFVHQEHSRWWTYPGIMIGTLCLTRFRAPRVDSHPPNL